MTILRANLSALRFHYPDLATRLDAYPDKDNVRVFKTKNGDIAYALRENGKIVPITDTEAAVARIQTQMEKRSKQLQNFTRPVMIIGLYPGDELLYIFNFPDRVKEPHAEQHIHVCIDSLPCLYGFLQTFDAQRVIESGRVRFFWHENTKKEVQELRNHPERPHMFTVISGSSDGTINRILSPFLALSKERNTETKRLWQENNTYYDAITDAELASVIAQESGVRSQESGAQGPNPQSSSPSRPLRSSVQSFRSSAIKNQKSKIKSARAPRLMLLTCSWSVVTQYSSRDTAAAFEALGWEVRRLNMDSMLTAYYLVKQINQFKPDVFLFINHLRTEATLAYPRNMMFVTWIQDIVPVINNKAAAKAWNEVALGHRSLGEGGSAPAPEATAPQSPSPSRPLRPSVKFLPKSEIRNPKSEIRRDLIIGYVGQLQKYGYPQDRLRPVSMIVNTDTFKPRELTNEQKEKYGCEICFASNSARTTEQAVTEILAPTLAEYQISEPMLFSIHDHLWEQYRSGKTFTSYKELEAELLKPSISRDAPRGGATTPSCSSRSVSGTFQKLYTNLPPDDRDQVIQTLFLRLNDPIYRQVVLEWLDDLASSRFQSEIGNRKSGIKIHLYGKGWARHPRFAKYAKGEIEHGEELSIAYQAAKFCLHLNSTEGGHQRLWEILASGAGLLTRCRCRVAACGSKRPLGRKGRRGKPNEPPADIMRKLAREIIDPSANSPNRKSQIADQKSREALTDYLFRHAYALAQSDPTHTCRGVAGRSRDTRHSLEERVIERLKTQFVARPDWLIENWDNLTFHDKNSLRKRLLGHL